MNKIEVAVLNPLAIYEAERLMACSARLTQHGHAVKSLEDFTNLYNRDTTTKLTTMLVDLPHPTLQKLTAISIVVIGASRRFLAQITRHQNEVKFVSASLQYSDYSDSAQFVVPYDVLAQGRVSIDYYLDLCKTVALGYSAMVHSGFNNDDAGYIMPQALRNALIISATPYQWKHMIGQRICRRNTSETRYVMLRIWEQLADLSPVLFHNTGAFCMLDRCRELSMSCSRPIGEKIPRDIIEKDFPLLSKETQASAERE